MRFVLLGPPASGKGTQGRRLAEVLGLAYLSTGALLRKQVAQGTDLGKKAEPILKRGAYLPDELMLPVVGDWLAGETGGWVLDGFPRSVPQAEFLDERLAATAHPLTAAISLEVPLETLLERIRRRRECPQCHWTGQISDLSDHASCPKCGTRVEPRPDDDEANFRNRYREFSAITMPAVRWYRERGQLVGCDASASPDVVSRHLLDMLAARPSV